MFTVAKAKPCPCRDSSDNDFTGKSRRPRGRTVEQGCQCQTLLSLDSNKDGSAGKDWQTRLAHWRRFSGAPSVWCDTEPQILPEHAVQRRAALERTNKTQEEAKDKT